MLEEILRRGDLPPPALIVQECSDVSKKRGGWYSRILKASTAGAPPPLRELLQEGTAVVNVDDMNGADSVRAIGDAKLDVLLLGGAGVVSAELFEQPRLGTLNVHPGYLPLIRGSLPVAWCAACSLPPPSRVRRAWHCMLRAASAWPGQARL